MRIGEQIAEPLIRHLGMSQAEAWKEAGDWLGKVRISDVARRLSEYPHEVEAAACDSG